MKSYGLFFGVLLVVVLYYGLCRMEGFKNVSSDAQNQITKIVTKSLPKNALCKRGAQCLSGKCLTNQNETLYGYCQ
jgi:hypothetical protein